LALTALARGASLADVVAVTAVVSIDVGVFADAIALRGATQARDPACADTTVIGRAQFAGLAGCFARTTVRKVERGVDAEVVAQREAVLAGHGAGARLAGRSCFARAVARTAVVVVHLQIEAKHCAAVLRASGGSAAARKGARAFGANFSRIALVAAFAAIGRVGLNLAAGIAAKNRTTTAREGALASRTNLAALARLIAAAAIAVVALWVDACVVAHRVRSGAGARCVVRRNEDVGYFDNVTGCARGNEKARANE
jgi:hypothetical protein